MYRAFADGKISDFMDRKHSLKLGTGPVIESSLVWSFSESKKVNRKLDLSVTNSSGFSSDLIRWQLITLGADFKISSYYFFVRCGGQFGPRLQGKMDQKEFSLCQDRLLDHGARDEKAR